MRKFSRAVVGLAACAAMSAARAAPLDYLGMCDASAAVMIGVDRFLVANDEDNILRVYSATRSGKALQEFEIPSLRLPAGAKHGEGDIEAAAKIGKRIYWIASHGSSRKGEARPQRRQFFATDVEYAVDKFTLTEAGRAYTDLLAAMDKHPPMQKYQLLKAATERPEADGALNIEGLAATPKGELLIGFRNPISGQKALLLPLKNPDKLLGIGGSAAAAPVFGAPIELALGGLGIRSIEYSENMKAYLIVAGPHDAKGPFKLFTWSGNIIAAPKLLANEFKGSFRPEAIFVHNNGKDFQVLSDDGDEKVGAVDCKEASPALRRFRSMVVHP